MNMVAYRIISLQQSSPNLRVKFGLIVSGSCLEIELVALRYLQKFYGGSHVVMLFSYKLLSYLLFGLIILYDEIMLYRTYIHIPVNTCTFMNEECREIVF